jgi:hypothetical protein
MSNHTHNHQFIDDMPDGYPKTFLHLWEKANPIEKALLIAAAVAAGKFLIDKITK